MVIIVSTVKYSPHDFSSRSVSVDFGISGIPTVEEFEERLAVPADQLLQSTLFLIIILNTVESMIVLTLLSLYFTSLTPSSFRGGHMPLVYVGSKYCEQNKHI
jgi:hypothetical protein